MLKIVLNFSWLFLILWEIIVGKNCISVFSRVGVRVGDWELHEVASDPTMHKKVDTDFTSSNTEDIS